MPPRSHPSRKTPSLLWLKRLIGFLLLIPGGIGLGVLIQHLKQFSLSTPIPIAFLVGAGVYLVIHLVLWRPIFMHVMSHELTHAFWAVILGGKIKTLLVSKEGGQVTLSKTNFLIALAPYFFPLYTFLCLMIYLIAAPKFYILLAFAIGFTLAFHFALTWSSLLRDRQSDIREVGAFFSLSFIFLMNILMLAFVLSVLTPKIFNFSSFILEIGQKVIYSLAWLGKQFFHGR